MKIGDIEYPSLKDNVSAEEWRTRVELAAIYRLIHHFGWFDLSMPGASARIPGEDTFLFNPADILFEEITASSLVKVSREGEVLPGQAFEPVPRTWFPMRAVHEARPDANFVIHSHDWVAAAISARREKILPVTQAAGFLIATGISYHAYDGVEVYEEAMAPLQKSLGPDNTLMILHNHGFVTLGQSAPQAFAGMYFLRYAAQSQLAAGRGDDLIHLPSKVIESFRQELKIGTAAGNPWPGLLRRLDRIDPTWRD